MLQAFRLPMAIVGCAALSFQWLAYAVLGRLSPASHMPLSVQFLGGAILVGAVLYLREGRLPGLSWRLASAAVTIGGLVYFLAPMTMFLALKSLPSATGAFFFSAVPLLMAFQYGYFSDRLLHFIVYAVGLVVYCVAVHAEVELRTSGFLPYLLIALSPAAFALGFTIAKRLYWTHSAVDLNFWSMAMAAGVHLLMAIGRGESSLILQWPGVYWAYLGYVVAVPTGCAYLLYQFSAVKAGHTGSIVFSLLTPVLAVLIGFTVWSESPINMVSLAAMVICLSVLALNSYAMRPSRWMVHYLLNDARQGDRLVCHMDAVAESSGISARIQIMDISIGGLGFRSDTRFQVGDFLTINLPIGTTGSAVNLYCMVAHVGAGPSADYPHVGGLDFQKLNEEKSQYVVEFLAKLSRAGAK